MYQDNTQIHDTLQAQSETANWDFLDKDWLFSPGDIEDFVFYYSEEEISQK